MSLKYYVYVSDSKVDMLFTQIPERLLKGIAGELKLNLGVLSASLKTEAQEESRYSKLTLVQHYLERHEAVGSIDHPLVYFRGEADMTWCPYGDGSTVLFTGSTETTVFGLGGSAHHIIGQSASTSVHSSSATAYLEAVLNQELGLQRPNDLEIEGLTVKELEPDALHAMYLAAERMKGAVQRMEFLAKRLLYEGPRPEAETDSWRPSGTAVLLGTPLYVALAE